MMQRDSFQSMVFKQIRNDEVFDDLRISCTDIESKATNNANIPNYSEGSCCARCVMLCAIWYHFYNLKNVKNTHGGVFTFSKVASFLRRV